MYVCVRVDVLHAAKWFLRVGRMLPCPRKKIHVILLHNCSTSEALILCANEHHLFSGLTESIPLKSSKRGDSPSELLVSNLPDDRDPGRVRLRLKKLSDNCGGRVVAVSSSSATIRFSNHVCASRAQKRMDGEDVYGCKISVGNPRRAQERSEREMSPTKSARKLRHNPRTESGHPRSPRRMKSVPNVITNQSVQLAGAAAWGAGAGAPCFPGNQPPRINPAVLQQMLFPGDTRTQSVPPDFRMPLWPLAPIGQLPGYQRPAGGGGMFPGAAGADQGAACKTPEGLRRIRGRHGGGQADDPAVAGADARPAGAPGLLAQKTVLKRSRTVSPVVPAARPIAVPAVSGVPLPRKCRTPSPYTVYDAREDAVSTPALASNSEHFFHPISVPAGSPVPAGASCPIELVVTNLDQTFSAPELQAVLLNEFKAHVMVVSLSLCSHSDGNLGAYVKVPSLQDAQFAISKLHRRRLGSKRMIISYAHVNGPNPQVIRAQIVSLLRDVPGHQLPLFKFCEMYESRYLATVSVADMYRMRDVCLVSEDSSGRMVRLNPELRNTPSPCPGDPALAPGDTPLELPYCSLHPWRRDTDKGWAEQELGTLPSVRVTLRQLGPRIDALLESHRGRLPLPSLPTCYEAQFGRLEVDPAGVPLEHLVSCLPGVELYQGVGSAKYLTRARSSRPPHAEDWSSASPPLASMLSLFCRELVDLLRTSPQCQLPFNRFIPAYHHHFGRQCRVANYGFTKLVDLLEALPGTVQVTLAELPAAYQRAVGREWNVCDYGVCDVEDLLGDLPESTVCVSLGGEVVVSMPKRDQTPEEAERTRCFAAEVVELLRHAPQCSMLFSKFIPAYHQHFGHQCRLADYGFVKLIELFEAISDVVRVEDGRSDGERRVCLTLGQGLKVLQEQLATLVRASPGASLPLPQLPPAYLRLYGHALRPEAYGCAGLRQLLERFPGVLEVVPGSPDRVVALVDRSDCSLLALRARRVLMGQPDCRMAARDFLKAFWRVYKQAWDMDQARGDLAGVVQVVEQGGEVLLELTPLQQFASRVYRLLMECGGCLKLLSFDFMYLRVFGVTYKAPVHGYPSTEAHLRAIPETVLLRGSSRASRDIVLNRNLAQAGFPLPPQMSLLEACGDPEARGLEPANQGGPRPPGTPDDDVSQAKDAGCERKADGECARVSQLPQVPYQDVDSPMSSPSKLWSPPTTSPFNHSIKVELPASLSGEAELLSPGSFLLPPSPPDPDPAAPAVPQVVAPHPSELPRPDPALLWGRSPSALAGKRRIAAHFDML
ncbi:meiosis regulator and mRNA stability factor 1 isoform X1 [Bacillus rossius redtenbacheri]|uniref:meiosis regulator and mRNA stability factor 1 isoform X1 n=1 Tax=Bacillus rossius redtenbacheri TaxID=93214 RepID=UPI002FDD92B2